MRRTKCKILITLIIASIIAVYATAKDTEAKKGVRFDPIIKNIEGWKKFAIEAERKIQKKQRRIY